ncbi:MAG: MT-A70 family methyltransferase [Thermodesulfobacteriota bacterium]
MKIDDEFKTLIFPLAEAEASLLEDSLMAEGCRDALVTWHGLLLDGHHRFEICQRRGIEFRTAEVELEDRTAAKAWIIRNQLARRNLTPFQRAELALKLEPLIAEKGKARMLAGKKSDPVQNSAQGKTRDELASIAGVSHDTISKAKILSEKASEGTLKRLRQGETSIAREHRILVMTEKYYELGKKKLVFPSGKYAVIYADPPWEYRNYGYPTSSKSHYPTMPIEEICSMAESIDSVAMEETALFLWATPPLLPEALQVMAAWKFEFKTHFVWDKGRAMGGMGWFVWPQHEDLLIGVRSKTPHPKDKSGSVFFAPRRGHSEKPGEAYEIIERMYEGPYLELFARTQREGWTVYGNEIEERTGQLSEGVQCV